MANIKSFVCLILLILMIALSDSLVELKAQSTNNTKNNINQDIKSNSQKLDSINKEINKLNLQLSQKVENKDLISNEIVKLRKKITQLNQNYNQSEKKLTDIKRNIQTLSKILDKLNDKLFANKTNRNLLFSRALAINQISDLIIIVDKDISFAKLFLAKLLVSNLYPQLKQTNQDLSSEFFEIQQKITNLKQQETLSIQAKKNYDQAVLEYNIMIKEKEKLSILSKDSIKKLQDQVSDLSKKSTSLQELIAKINAAQKLASKQNNNIKSNATTLKKSDLTLDKSLTKLIKDFPSKSSKMMLPAVKVDYVSLYGKVVDGIVSKAISFKLNKKEHILAPFDGIITFSDKFKDFGNLIIISHKQEYFSVIYGLDEITNNVGQWVLKGEIIGYGSSKIFQELRLGANALNPKDFITN